MKKIGLLGIGVVSILLGCAEIIGVPDISRDQIQILAPSENAILETSEVTFSWEELEFAEQYQIQVATPNFETADQIVLNTMVGDSTQVVSSINTNLSEGTYQWRVRGLNSGFQTAYTTQSFSITMTNQFSEQTVVLLSPEDALETAETSLPLEWEAVEEAIVYRVMIIDLSDDSVFFEQATMETNITVDFVTGNYQWQVRAENDTQNTPYSERTLTIL